MQILKKKFLRAMTFVWERLTTNSPSYRPERHYMRGPGPACRTKNSST